MWKVLERNRPLAILLSGKVCLNSAQWFLDDMDVQDQDPKEIEADSCARNSLIQIELWQSKMLNSVSDIIDFAKKIKIHPSIVIGRLRREMGDYSLYAKTLKIPKVRHFFIA